MNPSSQPVQRFDALSLRERALRRQKKAEKKAKKREAAKKREPFETVVRKAVLKEEVRFLSVQKAAIKSEPIATLPTVLANNLETSSFTWSFRKAFEVELPVYADGLKPRIVGNLQKAGLSPKVAALLARQNVTDAAKDAIFEVSTELWNRSRKFTDKLVLAALAGKEGPELLAMIEKRLGVSPRQARNIAKDLVHRVQSKVAIGLAQKAGITEARWLTKWDAKVRKTHRAAHGKSFNLAVGMPNVGLYGEHGLPGQIRNCRCWFIPIIPRGLKGAKNEREIRIKRAARFSRGTGTAAPLE